MDMKSIHLKLRIDWIHVPYFKSLMHQLN